MRGVCDLNRSVIVGIWSDQICKQCYNILLLIVGLSFIVVIEVCTYCSSRSNCSSIFEIATIFSNLDHGIRQIDK